MIYSKENFPDFYFQIYFDLKKKIKKYTVS